LTAEAGLAAARALASTQQELACVRDDLARGKRELAQVQRDIVDAPAHALQLANAAVAAADAQRVIVEAATVEANRRRGAFLITVAHELRNPLMPLRLAAAMLDRARPDADAHARLQATISGQVAQMARLIGDLLEGSRISVGQFRLERTLIDVVPVLERAMETCRPAMDVRGHRFARTGAAQPVMILGDAVRLVQVFGNLLENSSRYTPPGGDISLGVEVRPSAVAVTVADNGIGISPGALPFVFDMFVRDPQAVQAESGGLGIGLSVVRELVTAHEGTVHASSAGPGCGSQFVVTLPLASRQPRAA
jgi:signal transduction histidine kinase